MKIKKNISIDKDLRDRAVIRAKELYTDFSGYVTSLILRDLGEIAITEEIPKIKNDDVSNAITSIMGE